MRDCVASCINHLGRGTHNIITSWVPTPGSGHRQAPCVSERQEDEAWPPRPFHPSELEPRDRRRAGAAALETRSQRGLDPAAAAVSWMREG